LVKRLFKLISISVCSGELNTTVLKESLWVQLKQAGCPSCHPTNSVKALKGTQSIDLNNGLQVQGTSHEAKQRHKQLEMTGLVDVSADS